MIKLREFRPDDWAALVEMDREESPPHSVSTVAEWEESDRMMPEGQHFFRLVASDENDAAIGFLDATDNGTISRRQPGVCALVLVVLRAHRGKGLGSALYEKALEYARSRDLHRMVTWVTEFDPKDCSATFYQNRGFVEQERAQGSSLLLTAFDASRFTGALERVQENGIRLWSWAEVGDTEENRKRLYALTMPISRDMPNNDPDGYEDPPFEEWSKRFERPSWDSHALILAEKDGAWIGLSQLGFQSETNIGHTWVTGILSPFRGMGIATALKLRTIERAQERGCTVIATDNHVDNAPMLAINRKMGYLPDPPWVKYSKELV